MLAHIKILLGISDSSKDALLNLLIDRCIEDAINITHDDDIDEKIPSTIENMVIYHFNRLGSEGLSGEGYSGVSFNYNNDYPNEILKILISNRKLRIVQ